MSKRRNMKAKEFREKGFLQELNRQFLHPMGLALQVVADENGEVIGFGDVTCTDDEEGMKFQDLSDRESHDKAAYVEKYQYERARKRSNALGYITQPLEIKKEEINIPEVDRSQRTLTDGGPVTDDHRELKENGQQKGYVVLSEEERKKGFVRPVRTSYVHVKCGTLTKMGISIAETYARDPKFYNGTYCCGCGAHFSLEEFVWDGTNEIVGS
jgi:hypothetical protein